MTTAALSINARDLVVTRTRALRGPNYWRLAPVIASEVRLGSLEQVTSTDVPGFVDRLLTLLPSLADHPCTREDSGGFVARLREGTYLPHILEHVALELQSLSGSNDVAFGRVVASGDDGIWWVIVAYEEEDVGIQAIQHAADLVRACIAGEPYDIKTTIDELHELYEDVRLGPSTAAIVEEARRRGIPVRRLNSGSLVQLGLGKNLRRIQATLTDYTSAIAVEIAQDKNDTKRVLRNIGLPVPDGDIARSVEEAIAIANELGYPVILKPLDANQGKGISGRIDDDTQLEKAWDYSSATGHRLVIERFVTGRDYRVLVVDGKVVAAAERVAAHVIGDGISTIRQLIAQNNQDSRRGIGHTKMLTRLPDDVATRDFLALNGRTLDTVPALGERVFLRSTANLSTGGTSIDRTDEVHPDNVTACEMAADAIGLDIAGIDVITPDISVPFRENGAVIIEVNAAPGIRMHTHPAEGKPRNVGAPILDMLYPNGDDTTIPVIAVTGTNGKTTTARLIAHICRHTGKTVGLTTTDGIYINHRLVMEGDMTGPFSANVILSNPTIDVAVLETARGGILRAGLGFDEADVGIVLNIASDHLGERGIHTLEQLAEVKGVIPAVVRRGGHAVLNADDPLVLAMQERTSADVVFISAQPPHTNPHVEAHLATNGIAVRVEDGSFVILRGRLRIPIAHEREVPLMLGGAARFQQTNILAAIAAAYVQGVRYDDIRAGLLSFFPSPSMTPGRLNVIRVRDTRVLIDYAHNAPAVTGLLELVAAMPANRRIGVITAPGDRRDADLQELGRLCATLDYVVIKEDKDRRGRNAGEIATLIRQGLRDGGLSADRIETVLPEQAAIDRAMELADENDVVVVLAEKVPEVLTHVEQLASKQRVSKGADSRVQ
jgi:cyanophycin synthetase